MKLLTAIVITAMINIVDGECDPYTQCFGHGEYNAKAKTCSCYKYWEWGRKPYTGRLI